MGQYGRHCVEKSLVIARNFISINPCIHVLLFSFSLDAEQISYFKSVTVLYQIFRHSEHLAYVPVLIFS